MRDARWRMTPTALVMIDDRKNARRRDATRCRLGLFEKTESEVGRRAPSAEFCAHLRDEVGIRGIVPAEFDRLACGELRAAKRDELFVEGNLPVVPAREKGDVRRKTPRS